MFWLVIAVVAFFVIDGTVAHLETFMKRHGLYVIIGRWLGARPRHGKAITNRGMFRSGHGDAFTPTKHARWVWFLPAWRHIWRRVTSSAAAVMLAAGLLFERERTETYLAVTATGAAAYGSLRAWYWAQSYTHRKNYLKPLQARLAPLCSVPLTGRPESWLEIPRDRKEAVITMPRAMAIPSMTERKAIESAAVATLGMSNPHVKWQFTSAHMKLRLKRRVPPPLPPVTLAMLREAIAAANADEIVLGIGEDHVKMTRSLEHDSPHWGLSVDSGKGKSVSIRCLIPQVLFRGGIALVLDNKRVSHPSLRLLPNVAYCAGIEKIHKALVWLDKELDNRAEFVEEHTSEYGVLTGSPGPQMAVVLEEMNLTMNRLRSYWEQRLAEDKALPKEDREYLPAVSPAIRALENLFYAGRELKIHLFFISQRMSAKATAGSGDVRMNIGVRMLAGYDEDTWKMLVGKSVPMPPASRVKGRFQVYVKGGELAEVQIGFFTHRETRELALGGLVTPLPPELEWATRIGPSSSRAIPGGRGEPDPVIAAPSASLPPPVRGVTASEARESGWLPWNTDTAFRVALHRARGRGVAVPEPIGLKGAKKVYDAVELADFAELVKPDSAKAGASA